MGLFDSTPGNTLASTTDLVVDKVNRGSYSLTTQASFPSYAVLSKSDISPSLSLEAISRDVTVIHGDCEWLAKGFWLRLHGELTEGLWDGNYAVVDPT